MEQYELNFMKEAIEWANACHPSKESIPKVGAIIADGKKPLGRGRRGTGLIGDDEHAEWHAINDVGNKSDLARATLYTTLEPCTMGVRSKPHEACTELIRQHQIKKVFVGILDPNQGVTGKGLLGLQESGIEVQLFPHALSGQILAQNAPFIRSQKTLGAEIVSPKHNERLQTFKSNGRFSLRFKCLNPPAPTTFLLIYRGGLYWPQVGAFRQIEPRVWEIDAHFGGLGEYVLQLVTANDLGSTMIQYYQKIVESNRNRRERLHGKVDEALLGGDYPGIQMNGLPKGLRLEASVTVFVLPNIILLETSVEPGIISRGASLKIKYKIQCLENVLEGIWLGASFQGENGRLFHNTREDKAVSLTKGMHTCERTFTIEMDAPLGEQRLKTSIWLGIAGESDKSKWIAGRPEIPIKII